MSDDIQKQLKKRKVLPLGVEGTAESGWVLLDYNGVIVHLFNSALRDYYQLEQVWAQAPVVVRMQ
jgi:ribosome-associated protein